MSPLGVAMPTKASGHPAGRLWARLLAALAVVAALLAPLPALAAFTPPPLDGHVVDTAGKLTPREVLALDQKIDRIRRQTGFAVVAFVVGSLEGETIDDVAYKAFNAWGVGEKGKDNGVLLVIAPNERKVRIETGKGVGGALTDLQSNDIIRNVIAPLLQQERFAEAIDKGTSAIAQALVGGTPENERPKPQPGHAGGQQAVKVNPLYIAGGILAVIILAIISPTFRSILWFLLQILFFFGGRGGGGGSSGGGGGWGGSGYSGGGGRSGGGGSSDSY